MLMNVLVLAAQKGGTGKTTICANLAVEAEARGDGPVAVIDVDPQGTLSKWWNRRQADTPALVEIDVADIDAQLRMLQERGTQLVIVDTPGAITSHVRAVIRAADLVPLHRGFDRLRWATPILHQSPRSWRYRGKRAPAWLGPFGW